MAKVLVEYLLRKGTCGGREDFRKFIISPDIVLLQLNVLVSMYRLFFYQKKIKELGGIPKVYTWFILVQVLKSTNLSNFFFQGTQKVGLFDLIWVSVILNYIN